MYRWLTIRTASTRAPRHSSPRRKKPAATTRSRRPPPSWKSPTSASSSATTPPARDWSIVAPRTPSTHRTSPSRGGSVAEAVEALRVAGEDQLALVGGHAGERVWDGAPRVRPVRRRCAGSRATRACARRRSRRGVVCRTGSVMKPKWKCSLDVLARQHARCGNVLHRGEALVVVVDLLLHVRHPPAVDLGRRPSAGRGSGRTRRRRSARACGSGRRRSVRSPAASTRCAAGIESVSDTWMLSGTPSSSMRAHTLSSSGVELERAVRVAAHHEAADARAGRRRGRSRRRARVDAAVGEQRQPAEARRACSSTYSESQSLYARDHREVVARRRGWRRWPG